MSKKSKMNNKETADSTQSKVLPPSSESTTADLGRQYGAAQQKFERTTNEANLEAYKTLLTAYRDYAAELHNVHQDFEGHALEVYQNYLTRLSQAWAPGVAGETGSDHFWEFVRLATELSGAGGWRDTVEKAYRELLETFAVTESPADSVARQAEAYRVYVEQLSEAWKEVEPKQKQAEQAYLDYVRDYEDGLAQGQTALESAYKDYLKELDEAYVSCEFEERAAAATKDYLEKAQQAYKQSQSVHADAAKGLIETQETLLRNVQPEQSVSP